MGLFNLLRLILIGALVYYAVRWAKRLLDGQSGGQRGSAGGGNAGATGECISDSSPHEILGVPTSASPGEIKEAYQRLIQQYHPDRVADLGPELREVAERRTKEINVAYTRLKRL